MVVSVATPNPNSATHAGHASYTGRCLGDAPRTAVDARGDHPVHPAFRRERQRRHRLRGQHADDRTGYAAGAANARAGVGTKLNNNDFSMVFVDVDSDRSTFNSSRADLALPAGGSVLFAGLYWGAESPRRAANKVQFQHARVSPGTPP